MSYRIDNKRGVVVIEAEVPVAEFLRLVLRDDVAALLAAPEQTGADAPDEQAVVETTTKRKRVKSPRNKFTEDYVRQFITENGPCGVNRIAKSLGRATATPKHYALVKFLVEDGQLVQRGSSTHVTYALAEDA